MGSFNQSIKNKVIQNLRTGGGELTVYLREEIFLRIPRYEIHLQKSQGDTRMSNGGTKRARSGERHVNRRNAPKEH